MTPRVPAATLVRSENLDLALAAGTTFSNFEIVSPLGSGGMGEVYKAWDSSLKRHVALKVLHRDKTVTEEMLRRFAREARAASALNHPNIVTVYEVGRAEVGGEPVDFMAMELIEGETLRSFLSRRVEMPKALNYLAQIADGLAKAHAAGILHRDLKPENIMITSDGFAKILDFGLATTRAPESASELAAAAQLSTDSLTLPGTVMGTVGYMSPEQVRGLDVDHRSDLFSFGCILYEVLTRRRPFQGKSAVDTFHKIVYEPPPLIGDVDPPVSDALGRATLKCLGKDPDTRYQSAKEIAIDLREIRREYESGLHSLAPQPVADPRRGAPRALWLGLGSALLIAAIAVLIWSKRPQPPASAAGGGLESMTITRVPATSTVQWVSISPDGRYIAHVEATPQGDALRVRQVATGSEIEAAPADGKPYTEVSFSADGEYIRYVHDGALRQSPVLGGSAKILIDKFAYPVSFSPDGKHCAFVRDGNLFVVGSDGRGERRIAESTNGKAWKRPAWSPRGDVIACIRGSERRVETGTAFAGGTGDGRTGVSAMEVAPPGSTRSAGRSWNTWIETVIAPGGNPSSPAIPVTVGEGWSVITSLGWLPDATGIVISASRQSLVEKQLYEVAYPSGKERRLTNDLFEYNGAAITADGRMLVSRQTDKRSSIWQIPVADPGKGRRILEGVGMIRHVTAAPNGDVVFGASSEGNGNADIWRIAGDGGAPRRLTDDPASDLMPAVSPDGATVAFISGRSGQTTIWIMDSNGANQRQVTREGRDVRPRFAPDGKSLIYNSRGGGGSVIYRITLPDGKRVAINSANPRLPAPSPDGRFIASLVDDARISVMSATDGAVVRTFDVKSSQEIRWTVDSSAFAVTLNGAIYLQRLSGGEAEKILDLAPDDIVSFDWTADGKSLLVARVSNQWSVVTLSNFR